MEHISVLKDDVCKLMNLNGGEVVVDATLGLGGHSSVLIEKIGAKGLLIGFDQDEVNLKEAKKRLKKFKNIVFVHDNFRSLKNRVEEALKGKNAKAKKTKLKKGEDAEDGSVDAILFDLGISSPHVDEAERGFSFMKEGPLDMRYSKTQKLTAWDIVNAYREKDLADLIYLYGEERFSRRIAKMICERRKEKKFDTTKDLADAISRLFPKKFALKIHPATKTFQALRIAVNDELNALKEALDGSIDSTKKGGRIAVISYHSLEDRIVKHFFKELARECICPKEVLRCVCRGKPVVELITKKPIVPSDKEIKENPRARSAKLRVVKKL
mgnify:CR=1 FL=1